MKELHPDSADIDSENIKYIMRRDSVMAAYRILRDDQLRKRYDRALSFEKAGRIITGSLDGLLEVAFSGDLEKMDLTGMSEEEGDGLVGEREGLVGKIEEIGGKLNETVRSLEVATRARIVGEAREGVATLEDVKELNEGEDLFGEVDLAVWETSEEVLDKAKENLDSVNEEMSAKGKELGKKEKENTRLGKEIKELQVRLNILMAEKAKNAAGIYELGRDLKKVERAQMKETKRVERLGHLVEKKRAKTLRGLVSRWRGVGDGGDGDGDGEGEATATIAELKEEEERISKEVGRLKGRKGGWVRRRGEIDEKIKGRGSWLG
ncbi:hypothetical protein TL16_g00771 [Triparma laevis f. inornata]|uniref:J domain-containing protein n=1 Tax=Triparma laevis f. inornata TaxID=1714386 RepID=A0A9W6Z9H2_9STRA|nr:hypothetical protein TL16_g00771 [Triparma laevis f. inornata]